MTQKKKAKKKDQKVEKTRRPKKWPKENVPPHSQPTKIQNPKKIESWMQKRIKKPMMKGTSHEWRRQTHNLTFCGRVKDNPHHFFITSLFFCLPRWTFVQCKTYSQKFFF
jgi:hypothetical protein